MPFYLDGQVILLLYFSKGIFNVKFISYDSIERIDCETEIKSANSETIRDYRLTWDPFVNEKIIIERDRDFNYRCFEWDRLIHMSLNLGFDYKCFAAYTGARLDGLLALRNQNEDRLYLDFFATAPWNYYGTEGKMRRIGSGLVYFTIMTSIHLCLNREFFLYAVEDAESYCRKIRMVHTGHIKWGLHEYHMSVDKAAIFEEDFQKYIIDA